MTGFQRAALMHRLADLITENAERLARVEVRDNGKLYREMIGQLQGLGAWYHYFAGHADKIEGRVIPTDKPNYFCLHPPRAGRRGRRDHAVELPAAADDLQARPRPGRRLHVRGQALGALPRLHAGLRPGAARGRLPARACSTSSPGPAASSAPRWPAHPGVDKVAFTGSTATGRAVAHAAAENVNRVTLELGGKSPQVVFEDADLPAAANGIIAGVFAATGQTCMAGLAGDRARERARRAGAPGRRARERDQARRPERPRDRDGPDRQPAAVREGGRLPRQGQGRGRDGGLRRRGGRRAGRVLRAPDAVHRGQAPTTPSCARRSSARSPRR